MSNIRKFVTVVTAEIILGFLLATQPVWLVFFLFTLLVLFILFSIRFRWGIYALAFIVPIAADHAGFHFKSNWSVDVADIIPIFPIIALPVLTGLALHKATGLHKWRIKGPVDTLLFLLVCWAALTLFWPFDLKHNLFQFFVLSANFLLYYLVTNSLDNENSHRNLIWCWITFGTIVAILTFLSAILIAKNIYSFEILDWLTFKLYILAPPVRPESVANTNETSFILNLTTSITIGMLLYVKSRAKKAVLFIMALFMMLTSIITLSKGGLLALLAMLYFLLFSIKKLNRKFLRNFIFLHLIVFFLVILQIAIIHESRASRIASASQASSLKSRINILWKPGIKKLKEEGALGGLSVGTVKRYLNAPHAHSIYFSTLFDLGIVGAAIASLVVLILVRNFFKMVRFQSTYLQLMFISSCGGLVAIGVHGMVDFEYNTPEIWFFLGISMATLNLARRELTYSRAGRYT